LGSKVAHPKTKGKRELLNLKSSINYGDESTSSRRWKDKAHVISGLVLHVGFGLRALGPCGFGGFLFVGWLGCSYVLRRFMYFFS
jgi:hypothetical protein